MKKILIVEDDLEILKALNELLKKEGFEVVSATDGLFAIKLAQDNRPDLVILDLMLPVGDGLTVLQRLKLSTHTNKTPILILTSMENERYKKLIYDEGVDGYFQKPYAPEKLVEEVKKLIKP